MYETKPSSEVFPHHPSNHLWHNVNLSLPIRHYVLVLIIFWNLISAYALTFKSRNDCRNDISNTAVLEQTLLKILKLYEFWFPLTIFLNILSLYTYELMALQWWLYCKLSSLPTIVQIFLWIKLCNSLVYFRKTLTVACIQSGPPLS